MLTLRSKKLSIIALLCACTFHLAYSRNPEHCESSIDMFKYSEQLHFVGEIGDLDFGLVNMSKTMHCCASGFSTIEWLKDGEPYPWSPTTSSFVADESTLNQKLASERVQMSDSGLYTCLVKNDSTVIKQDIRLEILDRDSAAKPRLTYSTKDQTGNVGDFARLYCEGFVGLDKKGYFSGIITWEKGLSERSLSRSFIDGYRVIQINIHRDENQILGSYLIFMDVEVDDLNMYTCRINNGNYRAVEQRAWIIDGRDPEESARLLFISVYAVLPMFALASVLAFLTSLTFPFRIIIDFLRKLHYDHRGFQEEKKTLLVVYHEKDEEMMREAVIPRLVEVYPFKVSLMSVRAFEIDSLEIVDEARTYDALMVLMTYNLAGKEWTCEKINRVIEIVDRIHRTFMFVMTKKIPPLTGRSGQKLKRNLRTTEVHLIRAQYMTGKLLRAYLRRLYKITVGACGSRKKRVKRERRGIQSITKPNRDHGHHQF